MGRPGGARVLLNRIEPYRPCKNFPALRLAGHPHVLGDNFFVSEAGVANL